MSVPRFTALRLRPTKKYLDAPGDLEVGDRVNVIVSAEVVKVEGTEAEARIVAAQVVGKSEVS